jgi:hypothetical protein
MRIRKLKTDEIEKELELIKEFLYARPCVYCGSVVKRVKSKDEEVKCSFRACNKTYVIWKNTVFYGTKLTKVKFVQVLQQWTFEASRKQISRNLDLPLITISKLLQKLR